MIRTFRDYLDDILTCFVETQEFIQGLNFDDFAKDRKTINAVVRSLEVMGEAARGSRQRSGRSILIFRGNGWLVCEA